MAETDNNLRWRLSRVEDDLKRLSDKVDDYGVVKERVTFLAKEVHALGTEVGSLRKALILAALSVTGSAVIFAATMFSVLG